MADEESSRNIWYSAGRDLLSFVLDQVDALGKKALDAGKGLGGMVTTFAGNIMHGTSSSVDMGSSVEMGDAPATVMGRAQEIIVQPPIQSISEVMGSVSQTIGSLGEQAMAAIESIRNNPLNFETQNLGQTTAALSFNMPSTPYTPSAGVAQQQGAARV